MDLVELRHRSYILKTVAAILSANLGNPDPVGEGGVSSVSR